MGSSKAQGQALVPVERIEQKIMLIRGEKVLLDSDLAERYEVDTKALTRAVRRNPERFPSDFMFQLTKQEVAILRRQIGTSSWGGRRFLPYAFTEQGIAMLSSVLRSDRAVAVNVEIMRAFVKLRRWLSSQEELAVRLAELEVESGARFQAIEGRMEDIFDILEALVNPTIPPERRIGFLPEEQKQGDATVPNLPVRP
ncbi:MAG: ORF6N domain-containing protein [Deltaproteobacteria bacterium]|nr:ORF6N domain-containing protein [Deltaproteobacteria bacterium]